MEDRLKRRYPVIRSIYFAILHLQRGQLFLTSERFFNPRSQVLSSVNGCSIITSIFHTITHVRSRRLFNHHELLVFISQMRNSVRQRCQTSKSLLHKLLTHSQNTPIPLSKKDNHPGQPLDAGNRCTSSP